MRRSKLPVKQKRFWPFVISISIFCIVIFIVYLFYKLSSLDKFVYVNRVESGDAEIILVDSKSDDITKYVVSGEAELESAHGYGKYKLKSLWVLSEKDENRGGLVADTLITNYFIPVYLWKDGVNTNMSFIQKIKVKLVSTNNNINQEKIDDMNLSKSIYINFSDDYIANNLDKIEVQDQTGDNATIEKASRILEVMGGKITTNSKGYDKDLDCEISSEDTLILQKVNLILKCSIVDHKNKSVGLTIRLGAKFAERF